MVKTMRILAIAGAVVIGGASATPLAAQERAQPIPAAYQPPPGMCRVWVDGVPANRQPAPTDCSTAVKNRPGNGRVIFGERPGSTQSQPPFLRSFGDRGKARGRDQEKEKEQDKEKDKDKEKRRGIPSRRP